MPKKIPRKPHARDARKPPPKPATHLNEVDRARFSEAQYKMSHLQRKAQEAHDAVQAHARHLSRIHAEINPRYGLGAEDTITLDTGEINRGAARVPAEVAAPPVAPPPVVEPPAVTPPEAPKAVAGKPRPKRAGRA